MLTLGFGGSGLMLCFEFERFFVKVLLFIGDKYLILLLFQLPGGLKNLLKCKRSFYGNFKLISWKEEQR